MAMTINTNVASLTAQRNLNSSQSALSTSMQRLSSGLRLNSAKDDAAGMAIAERMNTQVRGLNVAARNTINRTGTPDIIGNFDRNGDLQWDSKFGNYFGGAYKKVPDPACATVAVNLKAFCTNSAIADASGNIILQNAAPGQLGTLGLNPIYGPGRWEMDANISKMFKITESKNVSFRMDSSNVFNHSNPVNPSLDLNAGTFGEINNKTGNRSLAAQVRFQF